jgi:hypothetical protein
MVRSGVVGSPKHPYFRVGNRVRLCISNTEVGPFPVGSRAREVESFINVRLHNSDARPRPPDLPTSRLPPERTIIPLHSRLQLTLADFVVFACLEVVCKLDDTLDFLTPYPALMAHFNRVRSLPRISEYIRTRRVRFRLQHFSINQCRNVKMPY